jgi:hypothetical protein
MQLAQRHEYHRVKDLRNECAAAEAATSRRTNPMTLADILSWLFRPRQSAALDRAVALVREREHSPTPLNRAAVVAALRAIAAKKPETREELTDLEAEAVVLGEPIEGSTVCDDLPHVVWHFLSDADIRFKDERYREMQLRELDEAITAWEQHGV